MKHVQMFAAALLAIAVVGCGGTGNNSTSTTGTVTSGVPRLEAIVKVLSYNLMHPTAWTAAQLDDPQAIGSPGTPVAGEPLQQDLINPTVFGVQDPTNFQIGEQYVFQVVTYTPDSTQPSGYKRNILPGASFVSTDATSVYGSLAGNTGDYVAGQSSTTSAIYVTGTVNGQSFTTPFNLKIRQVRLLGNVLADTGANLLAGSQLQFFDSSGALVDTVTVEYDGTFRASVPTVTTTFTVVADSIPQTFYQSFVYSGYRYAAGIPTCNATLPTGLQVGTTSMPGGNIQVTTRVSGQGTPPPNGPGCSDVIVKSRTK